MAIRPQLSQHFLALSSPTEELSAITWCLDSHAASVGGGMCERLKHMCPP